MSVWSRIAGGAAALLTVAVVVTPASADTPLAGALPTAANAPTMRAGAVPRLAVTTTKTTIPTRDGVALNGELTVPNAPGTYPIVALPGTFGGKEVDSLPLGRQLATRGYVVVGYYERGTAGSGGLIEGGGLGDVNDVSDAIDYAIRTVGAKADASRIGAIGLSYGAGIVLMAAASDPRIDAVVSLSGWADMANAFYINRTPSSAVLDGLIDLSTDTAKGANPSPQLLAAYDALQQGDTSVGLAFANTRGVAAYLDTLKARPTPPALFMAEGMNEFVFPILETTRFWQAYPGRKRIELRAGDHGTPEGGTVVGIASDSWTNGFRWLDATLRGADDGILDEPPVFVLPRSSLGARTAERYPTLAAATTGSQRLYLRSGARPLGLGDSGDLNAADPGTRSTTLLDGPNPWIHPSVTTLSFGTESFTGIPPVMQPELANRRYVGVWRSAPTLRTVKLRGEVQVDLRLTPSAARGTVVAYALDVDPLGIAYSLAQRPYTWLGVTPGATLTAAFAMPFNAYNLPLGHRLMIAVATQDADYTIANPPGSSVVVQPGSSVVVPSN